MNIRNKKPRKAHKEEFQHAWKYFELHANQRISLFRYFIVFFSLFSTGMSYYLTNSKGNFHFSILIICILFICIIAIFWCLDERNRTLIHIAESSLRHLEKDDTYQIPYKIFNIEKRIGRDSSYYLRHTICFRALYILAIICTTSASLYMISLITKTSIYIILMMTVSI